MKKYKKDIITILEVLAFMMLWGGVSFFNYPIISYIGAAMLFFFWISNIVDKVKYRNNKIPNELRFPSGNEDHSKYTALTLGVSFIVGAIGFTFWTGEFMQILLFFGVGGLLLVISGLLDTPKGNIVFKENNLIGSGLAVPIQSQTINAIEISDEKISYSIGDLENPLRQDAKLSPEWQNKVKDFLQRKLEIRNTIIIKVKE
jgi:hypothetical protein